MPTRLRNAVATADAAQKEHRYDIPGLTFNDALTWRAGKPIAVADLLIRLQKLGNELRNFDDDRVDSRSFTTLAHDLANANLLGHKDKGVRAWTVACIVDVLRLCAPDAPFIEGQLKVGKAVKVSAMGKYSSSTIGHLYRHHQLNTPSASRSYKCLQCPACLHSPFSRRITKYSAGHRHPQPRESYRFAIYHCL